LKVLPPMIGLLAGYYIVSDGLLAMREKQQIMHIGDWLEPRVANEGLTVAFVNRAWRFPRHSGPTENELTPKLTWNWPAAKREHFWAFAGAGPILHDPSDTPSNLRMTWLLDPFGKDPRLSRPWQDPTGSTDTTASAGPKTGTRDSPANAHAMIVTRFIWVTEDSSGALRVDELPMPKVRSP
jgi:hypothetical protein